MASTEVKLIITVVSVIVVAALLFPALESVPAGYRGVVLDFGKPTEIVGEGLFIRFPRWQWSVINIPVQILKYQEELASTSHDQQDVKTSVAVNYQIVPSGTLEAYRTFNLDWEQRVIKPNLEESVKASMAEFPAQELITKRALVRERITEILTNRLKDFASLISIQAVNIVNIEFSSDYTRAIEAKVVAEQVALREKNVLEQIRIQAQQRVAEAEGVARSQIVSANATRISNIIAAEGLRQATILRGQGDAEALRLIREQLTDDLLVKLQLERWDGKLPVFLIIGGGEGEIPFILDISSIVNATRSR